MISIKETWALHKKHDTAVVNSGIVFPDYLKQRKLLNGWMGFCVTYNRHIIVANGQSEIIG